MKRRTIAAAVIIALVFTLITAGGCDFNMGKAKYRDLQLLSFSIESSGGMSGGRTALSARADTKNGVVTVYKLNNSTWYLNPEAECYVVDGSLLDEIKQIIIDEELYKAADAPISKMQVLDAPTTSHYASFSEGEFFSYSSSQELSNKVFDATKKIRALIEESCNNATAYPTVYVEPVDEYVPWKEVEEIRIDCANEAAFKVCLNVYNGTSENALLSGAVTLSKMDGDEVVYTDTLVEDYEMEVYGQGQDYVLATLPFDRYPEEGTYKIEYAGYETTFEMKIYKMQ